MIRRIVGTIGWLALIAFILWMVVECAHAQDLSSRVRIELLSQTIPATVNVSVDSWTTVQLPRQIESLEGGSFTQKPEEETGDFVIVPGVSWFTVKSLKHGASQNLGVVISGRVYEILVTTVENNDFSVLLEFAGTK